MTEAAPGDRLDRADGRVADRLDDTLLAHASAARAAHVIGAALIRSRDELPSGEYARLLHHTTGLLCELHAERLPEGLER